MQATYSLWSLRTGVFFVSAWERSSRFVTTLMDIGRLSTWADSSNLTRYMSLMVQQYYHIATSTTSALTTPQEQQCNILTRNTDILRCSLHRFGYLIIVSDRDGSIRGWDVHMLLLDRVGLLCQYNLLQVSLL